MIYKIVTFLQLMQQGKLFGHNTNLLRQTRFHQIHLQFNRQAAAIDDWQAWLVLSKHVLNGFSLMMKLNGWKELNRKQAATIYPRQNTSKGAKYPCPLKFNHDFFFSMRHPVYYYVMVICFPRLQSVQFSIYSGSKLPMIQQCSDCIHIPKTALY